MANSLLRSRVAILFGVFIMACPPRRSSEGEKTIKISSPPLFSFLSSFPLFGPTAFPSFPKHISNSGVDPQSLRGNLRDSSGQGLAEYLIIVVLVAITVIVGIRYFGGNILGQFSNATEEIKTVKKVEPVTAVSLANDAAANSGSARVAGNGTPQNLGSQNPPALVEDSGSQSDRTTVVKGTNNVSVPTSDESSSGEALSKRIASLRSDVGDNEKEVMEAIHLDWQTLALIGGSVLAIGVALIFRGYKKSEKKSGKPGKNVLSAIFSRSKRGEDGQAIAEFTFIAITLLFVILGVMQLALALNAYSLVRYAAYNAARAAIVHGGDHDKMVEAARLSLLATFPSHGRADHPRGVMENYFSAVATDQLPIFTEEFQPITDAEILDSPVRTSGETVTFDDTKTADKGVITVRVVHYYELVIPLVNRIMYYLYRLMYFGPGYKGQSLDNLSHVTDIERRAGSLADIEYRIPLAGVYTMRLQSDFEVP